MLRVMNMIVPFIMRTVMLHCLGTEYLGLNGLLRSILSFLNLAELGAGSAMVFSLYKPIAEDDTKTVCALLKLYRSFYLILGLVIAAAGTVLAPFLPGLIKGGLPQDMNLYILYFMNLASTVLTYWLFAYKQCLLSAYQRNDVSSKISLAVYAAEYALKMAALVLLRNYYLYLLIQLLKQISLNLLIARRVDQLFADATPRGSLPRETVRTIAGRVRDLFTVKVSAVIFKAADTLVVSSFMGLTALAVYQNYEYIVTALITLLEVLVTACVAGVGNSLITESREKNYRDLERLSLLYCWATGVCASMLLCMCQPFMALWMGKENLLSFGHVICFAVCFYAMSLHQFLNMFKDAAGIWRQDRWRPLVGALLNLGLNLLTVGWLGLYGVLLSSVISVAVVQLPWLIHNLFRHVFSPKNLRRYVLMFCGFAAAALISCAVSIGVCSSIHLAPWPALLLNACVGFLAPNVLFLAVFGKHPVFQDCIAQIKRVFLT